MKRTLLLAAGIGAYLAWERRTRAAMARRARILRTPAGLIELEDTGSGPPVLVLHGGGGGFDGGTWVAHVLGLREHRILAPSRPGYLGTPDLPTLDEEVDLYVAALDELGIGRVAVLGASAGGMAASLLAKRHPGRISRLVMLSAVSGPVLVGSELLPRFLLRAGRDGNTGLLSAAFRSDQRALFFEALATLAAQERRLPGVRRDLELAPLFEAPTDVAVPTLIVHGTADRTVPFVHAERSRAACARAELVAIEGGGHLCCLTHAAVGERIRAFLAA